MKINKKQKIFFLVILFFLMIKQKGFFMYGLISEQHLKDIIRNVVSNLGGGLNAELLLWETAGAETNFGNTPDFSPNSGYGLMQFDFLGFADTQHRTKQSIKDKIKHIWGIEVDEINIKELNYSPFLSVLFARLKYMLIPDPIPDTLIKRATYWKKYYNSSKGKGTIEHFIQTNINKGF